MINGKNFFDEAVKRNMRTYDNVQKNATDQGDDYTTGSLLNYNYFNKHYKMIAIDLSKQQGKAIQKQYYKLILLEICIDQKA